MMRHWQSSWPGRWLAALRAAVSGARVHPSAALLGARSQIHLGRGATIGQRCVLRADGRGEVTLDAGVWLARDVEIETETQVRIGARTTVQRRCSINGTTRVGADCIFAPDVFVSSGTHPFRHIPHLPIREQEQRLAASGASADAPVWIQDDCWIGAHAVIAPGVTIGKGCVIGANSVVTRDVPPYTVAAGVPARVIGHRLEWTPPTRVDLRSETDAPYVLCPSGPLLVALQPGAARVRVHYDCRRPVQVIVNGAPVALTTGTGEFVVPCADGLPFGAVLRIDDVPAADAATFTRVEAA
jgi:acetyltransferase-like isoleucine patch superfamily enzyme